MQPHHNQQLQPFCSGSNSAQSSPLKRPPQAVSPLASPIESRRMFMAHQQTGGEQSQHGGQQQQTAMGISPLQLGYAFPTCRLLVDPQTGQQYYVPTAPAPHPLPTPPAATAYFQPLFYNHPTTAAFYPAPTPNQQPHSSVTTTAAAAIPAPYLYTAHQPMAAPASAGFYAHHQANVPISQVPLPTNNIHHHSSSPSPPPPSSSAFYAHRSQSPIGRENGAAYRVEVPPSTVDEGSTYGRAEGAAADDRDSNRGYGGGYGQQHFQRRQQCRLSTESRGSSTRGGGMFGEQLEETHSNPEESAPYNCYGRSPPPLPLQRHHQQKSVAPPSPLLLHQQMALSAGGGSSSESTSGFASGCRSRTRTFGDEPRSPPPPHSPLREQRILASFPPLREEEKRRHQQQTEERRSPSPPPRRRAIRMDIDLSRPMSPPENASTTRMTANTTNQLRAAENSSVSVRATVLRTAPPTAFTISFNDESAQLVSISDLSLQEAARQAPKGRRLMLPRRSGPRGQQDSGSECGGDPKRWLFRKMMMGREGEARGTADERGEDEDDENNQADHEDMASEAGTYVVERKMASAMTDNQISGSQTQRDALTKSDSESTTSTTSSSSTQHSARTPLFEPKTRPITAAAPTMAAGKRSLMNDLRRLRENGRNSQQNGPNFANQQKKIVAKPSPPAGGMQQQKLPPPIPAHRKVQQQQQQTLSSISAPHAMPTSGAASRPCRVVVNNPVTVGGQQHAFSRNDGGRFSMRPAAHCHRPALHTGGSGGRGPIPMRQQSAANNSSRVQQQPPMQKSPEMLNWLRRKEYDPRKATTEQQKSQQLKAQESFMANRSFSALPSATGTITKSSGWRVGITGGMDVNRSHDDLSHLGESLDEESLLGAPDSCTTSLQRTVDELTQKCHKSITLLKLCNQSALSPSVEQLLVGIVESGGEQQQPMPSSSTIADEDGAGENISDRLERLSSAFDAIQKYLEEQTNLGQRTTSGTFPKPCIGNNGTTGFAKTTDIGVAKKKMEPN